MNRNFSFGVCLSSSALLENICGSRRLPQNLTSNLPNLQFLWGKFPWSIIVVVANDEERGIDK